MWMTLNVLETTLVAASFHEVVSPMNLAQIDHGSSHDEKAELDKGRTGKPSVML